MNIAWDVCDMKEKKKKVSNACIKGINLQDLFLREKTFCQLHHDTNSQFFKILNAAFKNWSWLENGWGASPSGRLCYVHLCKQWICIWSAACNVGDSGGIP